MKVLIAVDGSEHSLRAVQWYMEQHKPQDDILLIHTSEFPVTPNYTYKVGIALPKHEWDAMVHQADEEFKALKRIIYPLLKGSDHTYFRREGHPGHSICDVAKEEHVGMIVLGTRGLGQIRRTLLGSVSDYVLHHAHVPVAICRK